MKRMLLRARNNVGLMVAVGLLLRLGSMALQYRYHLNPALDHWRFGWEMGRVGRAIFEGHGFASPMYEPSGPTAWLAPVYPLLIATGFKLFGLYTAAAAWFILGLNALFGALTVLPIRAIVRRLFGVAAHREAAFAGWLWTLLPYSIYVAGERIWENTLTALLAALLIWLTYAVEEDSGLRLWTLWGALWGVAALTSPALLSSLPFLGIWIAWRHKRAGRPWFRQATASALVFCAFLAPWMLRNYQVFQRVIPLRDNFWLEMHVGNNGDDRQPCPDAVHPSNSAREREQYASLGELGYMDAKNVETTQWIDGHPDQFAQLTARRILFIWTGFWSLRLGYLREEPMEPFATAYFTALTVLAIAGFAFARRNRLGPILIPMAIFLVIFPLPYYVTHPSYDYRHAMDPILVILTTHACVEFARHKLQSARPRALPFRLVSGGGWG
jgi:4-amino-4-deoxy-L-arabinose transferase-like glycosyltransferase